MKIIENCSRSGIYHLTNNAPATMKIVANYYEQLMKVRGVEIIYGPQPENMCAIRLKNFLIGLLNHTVPIYLITEFSTEQIAAWQLIILNHRNLLMKYLKPVWNMQ